LFCKNKPPLLFNNFTSCNTFGIIKELEFISNGYFHKVKLIPFCMKNC
jgi:hypothetical protein